MARIGIDARIFGTKRGGIGRYTEELISSLPSDDKDCTFVLFMRKSDLSSFIAPSSNIETVCADIREYSVKEQTHMPRIIHAAQIDLLHVPHINVPYLYRGPLVVTVHDLIEYKYSRIDSSTLPRFLYRIKHAVLRFILPRVLNRADAIISVSRFSAHDIQKIFPEVTTPIHIIPHGAPRLAMSAKAPVSFPYVLYVGSAAPHKNVSRLLLAFKRGVEKNSIQEHAVLVLPDDVHTANIEKIVAHFPARIRERIHIISALSEKELASYIHSASLLFSASQEEGYGLPFIEALSVGTPVLAAFVGILPEIGGPYVHYWDPTHIDSMSKHLVRALHSPRELPEKPILQSWSEVVQKHTALYTSLANKGW